MYVGLYARRYKLEPDIAVIKAENSIILQSTTSLKNSGFYDYILPYIYKDLGIKVNEKKAIQLCVSAGTLIIFSSLTPHSSSANITKKNRKAYLSQYSSENIIDPFNGIQRGRAYLM